MASMLGAGLTHFAQEAGHTLRLLRRRSEKPVRGDFRNERSADVSDSQDLSRSPLALVGLIEGEIIPRMLIAHRTELGRELPPQTFFGDDVIVPQDTNKFAEMVLKFEAYALIGHVEGYLARGISVESVLVDLLAPVARRLGDLWDDDRCDFVEVTMGLWRLQEIVHEITARFPGVGHSPDRDRRALFAMMPGDQHNFGMTMVEEFFRRAGWRTWSLSAPSANDLVNFTASHPLEMVGLTVTRECELEQLAALVSQLRQNACNRNMAVMVGGRIFSERPELAIACGADATAPDARQAVARAEILLEMLASSDTSRC